MQVTKISDEFFSANKKKHPRARAKMDQVQLHSNSASRPPSRASSAQGRRPTCERGVAMTHTPLVPQALLRVQRIKKLWDKRKKLQKKVSMGFLFKTKKVIFFKYTSEIFVMSSFLFFSFFLLFFLLF
jgi:hypothetical protein